MKNPTPVLLDRLAHALEKRGIKASRAKLLEGAAAAFGFHNSNELTAAARRGDLTFPPLEPIGSIALPDGTTILVVRDSLANSAYAIDRSFVEQVVAAERREAIGVTPYGHLVSLESLPEAKFADLTAATIPTLIHVETVPHVREAIAAVGSYTAAERDSDAVGQAENLLSMVEHHYSAWDSPRARSNLFAAKSIIHGLEDDAERHLEEAASQIGLAIHELTMNRSERVPTIVRDIHLSEHLRSTLEQIDQEIENRRAGGDTSAWSEMQSVSDAAHAALRASTQPPAPETANPGAVESRTKLVAAMITLSSGESVPFVAKDEDTVYAQIAAWCRENDDTGEGFDGLDDRETVSAYFEDNDKFGLVVCDPEDFDLSVPISAAPVPDAPKGVRAIRLATVHHRHGVGHFAGHDDHEVVGRLAGYCIQSWSEVAGVGGLPEQPDALSDEEIVDRYFATHPTETYEIDDIEIDARPETAPQAAALPQKATPMTIHVAVAVYDGGVESFADPELDALYAKVAAWCRGFSEELVNAPAGFEDLPDRRLIEVYEELHPTDRIEFSSHPVAIDVSAPAPVRPEGGTRRETPLERESRIDSAVTWITDAEGEDTGQVTVSDLAFRNLPFVHEPSDGSTPLLTKAEYGRLGAGESIQAGGNGGISVQLGFSVLWGDRKWLAPEVEFAWDEAQDDFDNPAKEALKRAEAYVETIRHEVEAFGGQIHLFEEATDFAHEISILLPFDLAFQAPDHETWTKALGIMLAPAWTRDRSTPTLRASFDPQVWIRDNATSVDLDGRPNQWDAAVEMALSGREWAQSLINGLTDADSFKESPLAPKWVREWSEAFDVRFDDEQLEAFVSAL